VADILVQPDETSRLGTELEVVADFDLTPLAARWAGQTSEVRNSVDDGRHTLWLQLAPTEETLSEAVARYVAMVEALPEDLRGLWDRAVDRCLNTGVQAGFTPSSLVLELTAKSMADEARVSLRHEFTVYAAQRKSRPQTRR
jgi:hypothetical protein